MKFACKKFLQTCALIFLAMFSVSTCRASEIIVAVKERSPWYWGIKTPIFALYDDGTVMYSDSFNEISQSSDGRKRIFKTKFSEIQMERVKTLVDSLRGVYPYWDTSATDATCTLIWSKTPFSEIAVHVCGDISRRTKEDTPASFLLAYYELIKKGPNVLTEWLPEQITLIVSERLATDDFIDWPDDWTPLNQSSVCILSSQYPKFIELSNRMKPFRNKGKFWNVRENIKIPGEDEIP